LRQWPEASGGAAAVLAAGEVPEAPSLVRKAKAGDLEAFEQLMILHQRKVYAVALRLLGERADAQDATQEVFVRLYRHLGRFDERRPLEPWLYRMTVNACRDSGRRRRVFEPLDTLRASGADPHAEASRGEQSRLLTAAIRRLPEKERAALVLRDLEGLSTAEVARILGSSEGTVRSQVSTARLKLRALLGGRR
jgi:RNA polymerase sigma-70 factor (ECF subfamily)